MTAVELFPQEQETAPSSGSSPPVTSWARHRATFRRHLFFHRTLSPPAPRAGPARRKKAKKLAKHPCGFSPIRIDHGHRRGRHYVLLCEGRLAQLVERLVYTEDVGGSSPSSPTKYSLSKLAAMPCAIRLSAVFDDLENPSPSLPKPPLIILSNPKRFPHPVSRIWVLSQFEF